jgi:Rad3-related DNA helicase
MLDELKTHRVVFLSTPAGSGKSLIDLIVEKYRGSAYVTTPQTTLVDWYDTDLEGKFINLGSAVMGRSNYPCPYRHSLMEAGDRGVSLKSSLMKGFDSKFPLIRKLSLSAAQAPCTSESPSFIGNLPELRQSAGEKRELRRAFKGRDIESPEVKPSMVKECPFMGDCPYYSARNKAMEDATAVTTFHYFEYGVINGIRKTERKGE